MRSIPLPACSLRRCSWPRRRTPSPSAFGTATLSFLSSTITVPTLGDRDRQTFLRPFDFTGSVTLSGAGEVLDLTGNGTVRFDLIGLPDAQIDSNRLVYTFQQTDPVPEPATLLLLGTGIAGICSARRKMCAAQS
jgi:hypothetical protein